MPFEKIIASGVGYGENIKPLAQAWGDPVVATGRADSAGENIQPAGLWSTAPYIDPLLTKAAKQAALDDQVQKVENSLANLSPTFRRNCTKQGCSAIARRESDYCRWHQPLPEAE